MSPPWGGPAYSAKTFSVSRDIGGLGVNLEELLAVASSLLKLGQHFAWQDTLIYVVPAIVLSCL